jgi:uncharacterized repeat protein (TIGR04076 family)
MRLEHTQDQFQQPAKEVPVKRRRFIGCAAAAAPLLGSLAAAQEPKESAKKPKKMGCKITVVRRAIHQDLADKYRNGRKVTQCDRFKDGQEFVLSQPWSTPEGFCPWAWADIRTYVMANFHGGELPLVACCTDGLRPVHFALEKIELKA